MTGTEQTPPTGLPAHTHGADPYGEFGTATLDELDLAPEPPDDDERLLRLAEDFLLLADDTDLDLF
jgi:hypothetical protein